MRQEDKYKSTHSFVQQYQNSQQGYIQDLEMVLKKGLDFKELTDQKVIMYHRVFFLYTF